jgi:2-hydroxychromene-2-carboxylate isomerase
MIRKPRFYFSFHSPFSWMVSHQLERRLPQWHDALECIPYFEPDEQTWKSLNEQQIEMHYADMSKAKHLYILQDTKRLSAKHGLTMKWPVDVDPWWVLPHHAYMAARRNGNGKELYWALSEARWERGENICEVDVLRRIADSIGLDGDTLAKAPEDADIRAEGIEALDKAYMDDVFGVPFLKMGPHRFWGLDRIDDFLSAHQRAGEKSGVKA